MAPGSGRLGAFRARCSSGRGRRLGPKRGRRRGGWRMRRVAGGQPRHGSRQCRGHRGLWERLAVLWWRPRDRGGRVTVRARAARSGGGVQRSVTVRMMGRLRKSWSGSLWPGSRQGAPRPPGASAEGAGACGGGGGGGGEGFAAAGRTTEDEDGIGAVCAEGGEEPGEAAEPIGGTWGAEVEGGAEGLEGGIGCLGVGLFGGGEWAGGGGGFEGDAFAGGYGPALGGDFDELAFGVGEGEEDFFGSGGDAAAVDAVGDADMAALGIAGGLGFEVMEDGAEGVGGGDGVVEGEALVEDPLTEGAGANGKGEMAAGLGGNGDEGASAEGSEGGAALGDGEEGVEAGWAAGVGWGTHKKTLQFDV